MDEVGLGRGHDTIDLRGPSLSIKYFFNAHIQEKFQKYKKYICVTYKKLLNYQFVIN